MFPMKKIYKVNAYLLILLAQKEANVFEWHFYEIKSSIYKKLSLKQIVVDKDGHWILKSDLYLTEDNLFSSGLYLIKNFNWFFII